jgi:hypothetical protein
MLKERISRNKNRRHSSSPLPGREASFIIPPKVVSLPRVSVVSIRAYFQTLTECELGSKSGDSFRKTLRNLVRKVQNRHPELAAVSRSPMLISRL